MTKAKRYKTATIAKQEMCEFLPEEMVSTRDYDALLARVAELEASSAVAESKPSQVELRHVPTPQGWRLVPETMTPEMQRAAKSLSRWDYDALLEAAPAAPVVVTEPDQIDVLGDDDFITVKRSRMFELAGKIISQARADLAERKDQDEREAFEQRMETEAGSGAIEYWFKNNPAAGYKNSRTNDYRFGWVLCLEWMATRPPQTESRVTNALRRLVGEIDRVVMDQETYMDALREARAAILNQGA